MTFSGIVIRAANKLHDLRPIKSEEWKVGYWGLYTGLHNAKPIRLITTIHLTDKRLESDSDSEFLRCDMSDLRWIPHAPYLFMQQEEWPKLLNRWVLQPVRSMNSNNEFFSIIPISGDPVVISTSSDALSCAAAAWLQAVELE